MKRFQLLIVALVACTLALSFISGNTYAAADSKEVTASSDQDKLTSATVEGKKAATKEKKAIPHDVNINTADKDLLTQLPGIGPATAELIVQYREANGPFKSIDELTNVKRVGDKTLAKLKPYLQQL